MLIDTIPIKLKSNEISDSKSHVAPFRVVNIGNAQPAQLMDFIAAIEKSIGRKAVKNLLPMQAGDVKSTWADTSLLAGLTTYKPNTDLSTGVQKFVEWYGTITTFKSRLNNDEN